MVTAQADFTTSGAIASAGFTTAVDNNLPPSVSVISHSDGQRLVSTVTGFTLVGSASDDVQVDAVDVQVNGAGFNSATNTGTNFSTWNYPVSGLVSGDQVVIDVRATDSNNATTTTSLTISVNSKPTIGGVTGITDAEVFPPYSVMPSWTLNTVTDDHGNIVRYRFRLQRLSDGQYWNGTGWQPGSFVNVTTAQNDPTLSAYTFTDGVDGIILPDDLDAGVTYILESQARDADLEYSDINAVEISFSTSADVTGPVVTVTYPAVDEVIEELTPTFTGSATDDIGFGPGVVTNHRLTDLSDGNAAWNGVAWSSTQLTFAFPFTPPDWAADGFTLTDGHAYEFQTWVDDAAGNTGFSAIVPFTVALPVEPPPIIDDDRDLVVDDYIPRRVATPTKANYRAMFGDVRTGQILGELPVTALSWSDVFNGAGTVSATIPIVQPNPTITPGSLAPRETTLWVEEDGEYVMGGILLTTAISGDSMTLAATGFFDYLRRRIISNTRKYSGVDQLAIAQELAGVYGGPVGISYYTPTSGVNRTRNWFWWENKNVGEAITQLAATEDGFDFRFIYPKDVDNSPRIVFETTYPATGLDSGLLFEHERHGVTVVSYEQDAVDVTNTAITVGAGNDKDTVRHIGVSNDGLARYVPLETVFSHSSVIRESTLVEHAGRHLARTAKPIARAKVKIVSHEHGPTGYKTGDIATVKANVGLMKFDQKMRITSISVTYQGTMRIATLDLVGVEVFA